MIAKNEVGYKKLVELSSISFLENDNLSDPFCKIEDLYSSNEDIIVMSGTINGLIGKLFNKSKFEDIEKIFLNLKKFFNNNFYIEIQRHGDLNEKQFELYNLNLSSKFNIPIIATHEVFYIDKNMHDAHEALICIGNKTYLNDVNRIKYSDNHYLMSDDEMKKLFYDLPEALENNYNLPLRCSFRPSFFKTYTSKY